MIAEGTLRVDPEFAALIPPPTEQELAQLEEHIRADGCRDPLVVWERRDALLDAGLSLFGWTDDRQIYAEIRPHAQRGYCHVTVIHGVAVAEGTKRGVRNGDAASVLKMLHCDPKTIVWAAVRMEPSFHNPWGVGVESPPQRDSEDQDHRSPPSTVYFVQVGGNGPVKIGVASHLETRLQAIQSTCPFPLRIIGAVAGGGQKLERKLHRQFSTDRLRGEWFLPSKELIAWISEHAEVDAQ